MFLNRWRRDAIPRTHQYDAPTAGIFDEPAVCIPPLNEKWIAYLTGVIGVLETGQYWTVDTAEHAETQIGILLYALQSGELCPPTETTYEMNEDKTCYRIVTDGIPGEWICPPIIRRVIDETEPLEEYEECEEMANCNCANSSVRFCNGRLEYRDENGAWQPVPGGAVTSDGDFPDEDLSAAEGNITCYKAYGVWDNLKLLMVAMWDVASSAYPTVPARHEYWLAFKSNFKVSSPDLLEAFSTEIMPVEAETIADMKNDWLENIAFYENMFTCEVAFFLKRQSNFDAVEMELLSTYTFGYIDNPELQALVDAVMKVPSATSLKTYAASRIEAQSGICNCESAVIPPDGEDEWTHDFAFEAIINMLGWQNYEWVGYPDAEIPEWTASGSGIGSELVVVDPDYIARRGIWLTFNGMNPEPDTRITSMQIFWSGGVATTNSTNTPHRTIRVRVWSQPNVAGDILLNGAADTYAIPSGNAIFSGNAAVPVGASLGMSMGVGLHVGAEEDPLGDVFITSLVVKGTGTNPFV